MDIDVLKELNLELLTERQRAVVSMTLDGKTQVEIGKELGCRQATVSRLIQYAIRRNSRILTSKEKPLSPKKTETQKKDENTQKKKINSHSSSTNRYNRYDYGVYKDRDLSILSQHEKEIMTLKIDGLTYQQIADRLDITSGCVGALIQKSRAKLDGTYHDGLRLTINRRRYESVLRDPVREKENRKRTYRKNRKKRIADMKEYNKKYYQQHREKLLKRQKERQEKNREEA